VAGIPGDEEGGGGASGMDERGMEQKMGTGGGRHLLWQPSGAAERKGRGPEIGTAWREGSGEERGASRHGRGQLGRPASVPGQWVRAAALLRNRGGLTGGTGRHRGPVGSGWVREGVRGSGAAWQGVLTGGPGSTVPAGRVLNPIQTESNYSKHFKQIQNCPNFGRRKSLAPKIGNKIWLEID
jgi:hypothetical protein